MKTIQKLFFFLAISSIPAAFCACSEDEPDSGKKEEPTPESPALSYEAVDLGLSVKWAAWNIGADSPEGLGGLYGWADSTGINHSTVFDEYPSATPPAHICGTEYDIATRSWGKGWRMPTQAEMEELVDLCSWEWTEMNGVAGKQVTGPNGNSIFLPAAASRTGENISNQVGQRGCYWSGSFWADDDKFAAYLYFYEKNQYGNRSQRRYIGHSVRAVYTEQDAE